MMSIAKTLKWSTTDRFAYQIDVSFTGIELSNSNHFPCTGGIPIKSLITLPQRNNSDDGLYTVFTGAKGMHNYGSIDKWEGKQRTGGHRKPCDAINGTTGEMWPPYSVNADKPLTFFVSHLCRSLNLAFKREETVKGIKVSFEFRF